MVVNLKNSKRIRFRKLEISDFQDLFLYLNKLSAGSKSRFGPHPFDLQSIIDFYGNPNIHAGFLGIESESGEIVAYSIIKKGFIEQDSLRYQTYDMPLSNTTDCTYAPSVADEWQRQGVGDAMFKFIISEIENSDYKRIVLWGGVQYTNEKAIKYYQKNGFVTCGQFKNEVDNLDMIRLI